MFVHLHRIALPTLLLLTAPAFGADVPDMRRLFPHVADVSVPADSGLVQLPLPPDVLRECAPGLADLRLVAGNREIPYFVATSVGRSELLSQIDAQVSGIAGQTTYPADRPPQRRERYVLAVPPEPDGGPWTLRIRVAGDRVVRRVGIAAVHADGSEEPIVSGGSLFRMRLGAMERENTSFALPTGSGPTIAVTLDGEEAGWTPPGFVFESRTAVATTPPVDLPLAEVARWRDADRTIVELERPGALVPSGVRVRTSTRVLDRAVTVWDEGPSRSPEVLGTAAVVRLSEPFDLDALDVPVSTPRGDRLRIEITDGDSPPLDDLAFEAVVAVPVLVFDGRAAAAGAPLTLLFGGARMQAPRYDLAGLRTTPGSVNALQADLVTRLPELPRATVEHVRANDDFDATPPLAGMMQPGPLLDTERFAYRREFTVAATPEGLSRFDLGPEDVAAARADFGDLRIVDADGHEWPYLIEPAGLTSWLSLAVEATTRDRVTMYRLTPPVRPTSVDQLLLETDRTFFDRAFRLEIVPAAGDGRQLFPVAAGRLAQSIATPHPVTAVFRAQRVRALVLTIEDGNDAPLTFSQIRARAMLPVLYLVAPPGSYALLAGDAAAEPPVYELGYARHIVLGVRSVPVVAGPAPAGEITPTRAPIDTRWWLSQVLLWVVLGVAVISLTGLTLRLARTDPPAGS